MFKNKYFQIMAVSVLLGFFVTVSLGFVFCFIFTILLFWIFLKNTPLEDRRYIAKVISVSLFLKFILLMLLQFYCYKNGILDVFGDGADNLLRAHQIKEFLRYGVQLPFPIKMGIYNVNFTSIFSGLFFGVLGDDVIAIKYINILCVVALGWLTYDFTRKIYNAYAARIAMAIVLFWPPLIIWSITGLKESQIALSIMSILWCIDKIVFNKGFKNRLSFIFLMVLSSFWFISLRYAILPLFKLYSFILFIYIILRSFIGKGLHKIGRVIILAVCVFIILFLFSGDIYKMVITGYEATIALNRGFLSSGGYNYDLLGNVENIYSVTFFLKFVVSAVLHYLLEPLPWNYQSLRMLTIFPIMIFWYFILLAALIGIVKLCKIKSADRIFPSFLFAFLYIIGMAMSIANIGTVFRFRDSIMPIVAIFASCGIASIIDIRREPN